MDYQILPVKPTNGTFKRINSVFSSQSTEFGMFFENKNVKGTIWREKMGTGAPAYIGKS